MKRLLLFWLLLPTLLRGELVTVELTNGQSLDVEYVRSTSSGLVYQIGDSAATQTIPLNRIAIAHFPSDPDGWQSAVHAFEGGFFEIAAQKFAPLTKARQYYPIPGNHASLAEWYLLQCHQRLLTVDAIAQQSKRLQSLAPSLPADRRNPSRETQAWLAMAAEDWEKAAELASSIARSDPAGAYLYGRSQQALGKTDEALAAYASTYTLNLGSSAALSMDALQRSVELLGQLNDENRLPEMQAQLKIYQELYGAGNLWKDAPEHLKTLAKADLETISAGEAMASAPPPLPPAEERDWIHYTELQEPTLFFGRGFGTRRGDVKKEGTALVFGPGVGSVDFDEVGALASGTKFIRIRALFEPDKPDGVLLDLGANPKTGGMTLFFQENQLKFFWNPDKKGGKTHVLGKLYPGSMQRLTLTLVNSGRVSCNLNGEKVVPDLKLPMKVSVAGKPPLTMGTAGKGKDGAANGQELPHFTGKIHHLSVGFSSDGKALAEAEVKILGKKLALGIPQPKPEATTPPPAPKK